LLFVIFVIQLGGGIAAFVDQDAFTEGLKEKMVELMALYPAPPGFEGEEAAKNAWDSMQIDVIIKYMIIIKYALNIL